MKANSTLITFLGGAAAAIAAGSFIKSKAAHKLAVSGLAKGLSSKRKAQKSIEEIREEAKDIYEEARRSESK